MTAIGDHLWQSTVFVLAAAALSWILGRNAARVRGWIWTAASLKFLVPFAIFIAAGGRMAWKPALQPQPQVSFVLDTISQPIARVAAISTGPARPAAPTAFDRLETLAFAVWAAGSLLLAVRWTRAWRRVHQTCRQGEALTAGREVDALAAVGSGFSRTFTIPIRLCDGGLEPGVFGVFRPVLLWPRGFSARLSDAQLRAVIAHEVCHVMRRDNLVAAVHTVVETLFWYHPLVWWVGARLVDERERACDEAVVSLGAAPEAYAEGILRTCEHYVESPLLAVSGITGSDLKKRIEAIMRPTALRRLTAGRKLLLVGALLGTIAIPLAAGALAGARPAPAPGIAPAAAGQGLVFESAAVKQHPDGDPTTLFQALPGGAVNLTNQTVRTLITSSYQTQDYKVVGGPAWLSTDRFDVVAKASADSSLPQRLAMVRSLLADRFALVMHEESREMPVYALTQAKAGQLGPRLEKAVRDCSPQPAPRPPLADGRPACGTNAAPGRLRSGGVTMDAFANRLGTLPQLGRPVINQTGLDGLFDIDLAFALDQPAPDAVSILTAAQEQLGLKLEASRAPVRVFVIDNVSRPAADQRDIGQSAPAASGAGSTVAWRTDETDHFDVFYQSTAGGELDSLKRDLERAYTQVATALRHDVPFRPALIVFATSAELQRGFPAQAFADGPGTLPSEDKRVLIAADAAPAARMDQLTRQIRDIFERDIAPPRRTAQTPTQFDAASIKNNTSGVAATTPNWSG